MIVSATIFCFLGAYLVTRVIPRQWEGTTKVMLNTLKPDPVTGEIIGRGADVYISTQIELIKDATVAGRVADQMGWLSDPGLIAQYQQRSKKDTRDYRQWLAQLVIDRTKAAVQQGSNVLEIKYIGGTAEQAKGGAEALRKAYLDASLDFTRDDALRNADWFAAQAAKAKISLDEAQTAKAAYQRANGIVMQDNTTDVDTARLRAYVAQGAPASPTIAPAVSSPASIQLAQIDAQIAQAAQTLGPNHPQLQELKAQRASVASLVAKDQAAILAANNAAIGAQARAVDSAIASQKSRVIAQSDKLQQLTQLQSLIDIKRDQYAKTSARETELRQQAAVADAGLTPLGASVIPKSPKFPNMVLIMPGSIALGFILGVLAALLAELMGRRVRGIDDLRSAVAIPVLVVINGPPKKRRPFFGGMKGSLKTARMPAFDDRTKVVKA
jgi:succinoglycan biosynthesis transport protein ExoP